MDEVGRPWVALPAYIGFEKDNKEIVREGANKELKKGGKQVLREEKKLNHKRDRKENELSGKQ